MMADTITLPGIGSVPKTAVYAGIGVSGGVVLWAVWKGRSGDDSGAIADPAAEAAVGDVGDVGGAQDRVPNNVQDSTQTVDTTDPQVINTNAEWTRAAQEYLVENGYDAAFTAAALGAYLNRQRLSTRAQLLVRAAIGAFGLPPVGDYTVLPQLPPTKKPPVKKPTKKPLPAKVRTPVRHKKSPVVYWVKHGDTLASIAKLRLMHTGTPHPNQGQITRERELIWQWNHNRLDMVARSKGLRNSQRGKRLFVGTRIDLK